MQIFTTPINGLMVVKTTPIVDSRGAFSRLYCSDELHAVIGQRCIVQINHSRTDIVGAVRGLHFQYPPHAEMKLVRCIRGRIWDIVVDLRYDSPTYLQWYAEELSPSNARMMVVPEGFAHGFQVLDPKSELLYLHTALYTPSAEGGLRHDDPRLAIRWPLTVTDLSQRDATHPFIKTNFSGVVL